MPRLDCEASFPDADTSMHAQVYYVPRRTIYLQITLPTVFGLLRLLRCILLRERITLVHAHQAFSPMAHEAILHARTMGCKVVFTDHSLFGFADVASILTNKALKFTAASVHQVLPGLAPVHIGSYRCGGSPRVCLCDALHVCFRCMSPGA